jgi:uncharacterized protein (TIGR04255 family)
MQESLGPDYAEMKTQFRLTQQLNFSDDTFPLSGMREVHGYAFYATDKRRVVQVQPDGFSLSILHPYSDWEELRDEARARWNQYVALTKAERVIRVGARFLNRIEIPLPANLKDWLMTYPEVGPNIPQTVQDHMMRLTIPLERGMGVITQLVEPRAPNDTSLKLILDIDVFQHAEFTATGGRLWEAIDELRGAKNTLFFGSITERTGDLYK